MYIVAIPEYATIVIWSQIWLQFLKNMINPPMFMGAPITQEPCNLHMCKFHRPKLPILQGQSLIL